MCSATSNSLQRAADKVGSATLLAEKIATGLHTMAQPLTAMQWHLEIASMPGGSPERRERELGEAQAALERVIGELEFLRDIIRPFRQGTEFIEEHLREVVLAAIRQQHEALIYQGAQVELLPGPEICLTAPRGFLSRILLCLLALLRSRAPLSARMQLQQAGGRVELNIILKRLAPAKTLPNETHTATVLQAYVEVLGGELRQEPDLSSIQISLPIEGGAN